METNTFFEALRHGEYNSMPKSLRELFILAVSNQNRDTLTVHCYARPTLVENAISKYRLQGIEIELVTDEKKAESIFKHFYKIIINVPAFLSNLNIFYNVSTEQLQQRYGEATMTLKEAVKHSARRKKNPTVQESKNPEEEEIILYKQVFEEVWKLKYGCVNAKRKEG